MSNIKITKNTINLSSNYETEKNEVVINKIQKYIQQLKTNYYKLFTTIIDKNFIIIFSFIYMIATLYIHSKYSEYKINIDLNNMIFMIAIIILTIYGVISFTIMYYNLLQKFKIIKKPNKSFYKRNKEIINTFIAILSTAIITWFSTKT